MRRVPAPVLMFVTVGLILGWCAALMAVTGPTPSPAPPPTSPEVEKQLLGLLDAPLLFVKRHSYTGIHIYDTYYKWPPGGGGIYVIENPAAPRSQWKIRTIIDPSTPGTLGLGVYTHPDLSWDAKKLLFCFKGDPKGSTSIYEIGIDGKGLRRLTDPQPTCDCYKGSHGGQHDIAPAYLPDGRIVFLSTRPSGLVPCANEGVSILHVMNADGSDMHPISVNNVNEFDPSVLPDGRILFGRWEYVDKNALTIQSLWTVHPDGTNETAVYANNMVFPEAILDARPVPGSHLIVGTFAKHNSTPRGSIAFIDPRMGKNDPRASTNLEHPDDPTYDRGDSCEPWPLSDSVVLFSGRPQGHRRNDIEMIDRAGHRIVVHSDPEICLHAPMLIKPRPRPPVLADTTNRKMRTGRFFVQDIYQGLTGVKRGEIKYLRAIEETSRVSASPGSPNPYNQTFLVSAALAFSVKNYLGIVPVEEDGSAYFEVPSGRSVYLQALDGDGRLVHSMRTFVQAAPGVTRSCIGCHEYKYSTSLSTAKARDILDRTPNRLEPESWGSGYMDYSSMVQPILDQHCVSCHGGAKGIAAGIDLSGGWTEHFNISYENLVNRRETQLVASWIAGIDCMNGTAFWSARLFPPRSHGSGAAPLAQLLVSGHKGYIPNMTRTQRDLVMAWIDSNGLYYGTWDYTTHGYTNRNWKSIKDSLAKEMTVAGCIRCHSGNVAFENDWINLEDPQMSRILRAPIAKGGNGLGLGLCRDRKVDPKEQRLHLLWRGYAHAVLPVEAFTGQLATPLEHEPAPLASFTSSEDPRYRAMLAVIRKAREQTLAAPRVDMPGADVVAGACRQFAPPPLPETLPALDATVDREGVVHLAWERSARTIGLESEIHRSTGKTFTPREGTLLSRTTLFECADRSAPTGEQSYALVLVSGAQRSQPVYAAVLVPSPPPPPPAAELKAAAASYSVRLQWLAPEGLRLPPAYNVYRAKAGTQAFQKVTPEPVRHTSHVDMGVALQSPYTYVVRTVSQRGVESQPTAPATASATVIREPVFTAPFARDLQASCSGGQAVPGKPHGAARAMAGSLDLTRGGYISYPHASDFDLMQPISIECWILATSPGKMPIIASCGLWQQGGWFLQQIGGGWRWYVGGLNCDGGKAVVGRWVHLACTFDGHTARLFQDGKKVGEVQGAANGALWAGDLCIGQYSPQQAADFQFTGRIAGVTIYHRPLDAAEVATAAKNKPQ